MPQTRAVSGYIKRGDPYGLKPAAAETTSTTGPTLTLLDGGTIEVEIVVTAVGGTPTMLVVIEGSNDTANWFTIGTIGANGCAPGAVASTPSNITAAGTYRGCLACPQFVRYRSVIGGASPSLTYSVSIEAA